jgi:hypothetical protein
MLWLAEAAHALAGEGGAAAGSQGPFQQWGLPLLELGVGQAPVWSGALEVRTAGRIENVQVAVYLVPVAACFVAGGLLAIWSGEVIRRGR